MLNRGWKREMRSERELGRRKFLKILLLFDNLRINFMNVENFKALLVLLSKPRQFLFLNELII